MSICLICKKEFDPYLEDSIFMNGNFYHPKCLKEEAKSMF